MAEYHRKVDDSDSVDEFTLTMTSEVAIYLHRVMLGEWSVTQDAAALKLHKAALDLLVRAGYIIITKDKA